MVVHYVPVQHVELGQCHQFDVGLDKFDWNKVTTCVDQQPSMYERWSI